MSPDLSEEKTLFLRAIEIDSLEERSAYLDTVCREDPQLRARVESLLRHHDEPQHLLDSESDSSGIEASDTGEPAGTHIGPYVIRERIAEGGFGVVYVAEQEKPVRRKVALKIIKPGMDTKEVIARFEAERQALALMDHPNIAKVLDAGTTETGRPFFVMELVRGVPITRFCNDRNLGTEERLRLFMDVCAAVQHAHQKGIIHRDLKPSNLLVTLHDGKPVPKVIDFGVAKALSRKLTEKTVYTAFGQMIGTPMYMSPEQTQLSGLDVDTRSDVYSLGVVLYELLTGTTLYNEDLFRSVGFDELRRIIREEEPLKPSARVSTLKAEQLSTVSTQGETEPRKLKKSLARELDWIVMKALEKERARRYESPKNLAEDVERYLNHEPVEACPPSFSYRFRMFARRNQVALITAMLVLASLIIGFGVAVQQAIVARREERRAIEAEASASEHLRREIQATKDKTELLWQSYLNQARALRQSRRTGSRFECQAILHKAAGMLPGLTHPDEKARELRDEWAASSALPADFRLLRSLPTERNLCTMDRQGEAYVFCDSENAVRLCRVRDDEDLMALPGPKPFGEASFSPDDRYLALFYYERGYTHGFTRIWNLKTRAIACDLDMPRSCCALDFSPDSRILYYGQADGRVYRRDLDSGKDLPPLPGGAVAPTLLGVSPDGRRLAVAQHTHEIIVVDLKRESIVKTLSHAVFADGPTWSSDSRFLAVPSKDRNLYVWDIQTGQRRAVLLGHRWLGVQGLFWPRSYHLTSWSWDATMRVWDPLTGQELSKLPSAHRVLGISHDERRMATRAGSGQGAIWEVETSKTFGQLGISAPESASRSSVAIDPSGRLLACATTSGIVFWDLESNREITFLSAPWCYSVAFHPDDGSLIASAESGFIRYQLMSDKGTGEFSLGPPQPVAEGISGYTLRSAITPNGRYAAALVGTQLAWCDLKTKQVRICSYSYGQVDPGHTRVAISHDGRWAATGPGQSAGLRIWDTIGNQETVLDLWPGGDRIEITFDPRGNWLFASTGEEGRVYEVGTWKIVHRIDGRSASADGGLLGASAASPDGHILAMRISGNRVRLIDTENWQNIVILEPFDAQKITSLAFGPDGSQLVAATINGPVYLWDLRTLRKELSQLGVDWKQPPFPPNNKPKWNPKPLKFVTEPTTRIPLPIEIPREKRGGETNELRSADEG